LQDLQSHLGSSTRNEILNIRVVGHWDISGYVLSISFLPKSAFHRSHVSISPNKLHSVSEFFFVVPGFSIFRRDCLRFENFTFLEDKIAVCSLVPVVSQTRQL